MAELEQKQVGGKKGKKKGRKKMSTRIDLTPMVDLGFLLVTFFMLTTTFSKPQTLEINLPVKSTEPGQPIPESKTIQILLGGDNKVYWFHGMPPKPLEPLTLTNFSPTGIRKVLQEKNSTIEKMVVLIKPTKDAVYKNVVDILDEMSISDIKRYTLVDIAPEDLELMKGI